MENTSAKGAVWCARDTKGITWNKIVFASKSWKKVWKLRTDWLPSNLETDLHVRWGFHPTPLPPSQFYSSPRQAPVWNAWTIPGWHETTARGFKSSSLSFCIVILSLTGLYRQRVQTKRPAERWVGMADRMKELFKCTFGQVIAIIFDDKLLPKIAV